MEEKTRRPRIGLLLIGTGRFKALGEGTERGAYALRKEAEAARMAEGCGRFAEVCFPGIVYTREDVMGAIRAFGAEAVDCVLACFLSWAEDFAWVRFLRDMPPVPILFAHVIRDEVGRSDTHDDDEFTEFLCCGGLVGTLEASGDKARFARPMMRTIVAPWGEVMARAEVFAAAAMARAQLRQSTVGLLACYNEVMWSTYVDPYAVFQKVGPELRFLSVAELCGIIESIPEEEAAKVTRRIAGAYEVLPGVTEPQFVASVRASMAMERQAEQYGLDLLVLNDVDPILLSHVGLRPGFWPTREDVRTLVVPEGDLGGGIACYLLKLLTGRKVNFIEPFHIEARENTFAGGHAGPNDYTPPGGRTKISRDVRFAKTNFRYAGAPFAWHVFGEGLMTMAHCSEANGRFRLAATLVESMPCEHFLATYSHGLFRPVGQTPQALFQRLADIGVTQHFGIVAGDCRQALEDFAHMAGFEYYAV